MIKINSKMNLSWLRFIIRINKIFNPFYICFNLVTFTSYDNRFLRYEFG